MQKFVLSVSSTIVIALIISVIYYQNPTEILPPQLDQTSEQEIQELPNEQEQTQSEPLQPVNNDAISYTLQNNELNITYNNGKDWIKVPIEKDLLFNGEYRGNQRELIAGSYLLTENRAAFLYKRGWTYLKYSLDQGNTWQEGVVSETFPGIRFRKVDFLNDQVGYVILSGDRTMSQEYSTAFLTYDGGETWEATASPPTTRLVADGGFLNENIGFLSYGTINPQEPDLYVTQDGGNSWSKADITIPQKYDQIFVQAEFPVKVDDHLSILVNQGPNGDYQGGKIKGKFISKDNGKTWKFQMEVQPNETEQG